MSDFLARAHQLQVDLESLLDIDADSEVTGGLDESVRPPVPCAMLTELAANLVITLLRRDEKITAAAKEWQTARAARHGDIAACEGCEADRTLAKVLGVGGSNESGDG